MGRLGLGRTVARATAATALGFTDPLGRLLRATQVARLRQPDFDKAARLPATPQAAARVPSQLWAGFALSGLGR
jgi:hypothetical protein